MWRKENSCRLQPMTGKLTPYIPSLNTLRRESAGIRNMFNYSIDKGWMTSMPVPSLHKNRRPSFTTQEWRQLTRRMRKCVKEGQQWESVGRDRFVSQQYVLVLANCGARMGELRRLRWNDLTTQNDGDKTWLLAFVKGKAGERKTSSSKAQKNTLSGYTI